MQMKEKTYRANLVREMYERKVKIADIAKATGRHRNAVTRKINGDAPITIDEAVIITETFFPDRNIKWLFAVADV